MSKFKYLLLIAVAALCFAASAQKAQAQVAVQIGPAPECPYGYFDYPPYDCAPYGYYGPEWFNGGVFIGAGPWYHGRERFWGHVDNASIAMMDGMANIRRAASILMNIIAPTTLSISEATKCATATDTRTRAPHTSTAATHIDPILIEDCERPGIFRELRMPGRFCVYSAGFQFACGRATAYISAPICLNNPYRSPFGSAPSLYTV